MLNVVDCGADGNASNDTCVCTTTGTWIGESSNTKVGADSCTIVREISGTHVGAYIGTCKDTIIDGIGETGTITVSGIEIGPGGRGRGGGANVNAIGGIEVRVGTAADVIKRCTFVCMI